MVNDIKGTLKFSYIYDRNILICRNELDDDSLRIKGGKKCYFGFKLQTLEYHV